MRKTNDLSNCVKRRNLPIHHSGEQAIFSYEVRKLCCRILLGEKIPDIKNELLQALTARDYHFENRFEQEEKLNQFEHYITRYTKSEGRPIELAKGNEVINILGEDIQLRFDFSVKHGDSIEIAKIRTSSPKSNSCDNESPELYAFLKWAKEKYPSAKTIKATYYYLKGSSDTGARKKVTFDYYDPEATIKKHEMIWSPEIEKKMEEVYQEIIHPVKTCTPNECLSCPQNNLCHYIESSKPSDIPKEVKPVADITLTNSQEEAIDFDSGIARINAGAGAGKTLVVALRIVSLLGKGVKPEDICLLTFTNSGAMEMTERVKSYCSEMGLDIDTEKITSSTFNAFCQSILEEHYEELGFLAPPRVIEDETKCSIIKGIMDHLPKVAEWDYLNFSMNEYSVKGALWSMIDAFALIKKNNFTRWNHNFTLSEPSINTIFDAYEEFNQKLYGANLVEYDDQIAFVFQLLQKNPTLFDNMGFEHIIVDEFQDTDLQQINLLKEMIDTENFKSFMAVGDDSQAIFSFRDTSPEYLIHFFDYFGAGKDFYLLDNHRSTKNIIDMANKINARNVERVEKDLVAIKPEGRTPVVMGHYTQAKEYEWLVEHIKKDVEAGKNPSDICFIGATKYELQKMADLLAKENIPTIMMNPVPYMENSKVLAALAFGESYISGGENGYYDLLNAFTHGALIEETEQEIIDTVENFKTQLSASEHTLETYISLISQLDEEKEDELFQSFLEKLDRIKTMNDLDTYLHDFKLYGQKSAYKKEAKYDGVVLTTAHSSKGLEWDTVYLSLSKFDSEPLHNRNRIKELEERRRLVFVGLTRAKENLYVSGEYTAYGDEKNRVYNQFLRECYEAIGMEFRPDPNQYYLIKKEQQIANAEKRAKAQGVDLNAVAISPQKKKAIEDLDYEFQLAHPGKTLEEVTGLKNVKILEKKDIEYFTAMFAKENALREAEEFLTMHPELKGDSLMLSILSPENNMMTAARIRGVLEIKKEELKEEAKEL